MSPSTTRTLPLASAAARFERRPRERSSSTMTSVPWSTSPSAMCDPTRPSPPVISARSITTLPRLPLSGPPRCDRPALSDSSGNIGSESTRAALRSASGKVPGPMTEMGVRGLPVDRRRVVHSRCDTQLSQPRGHRVPAVDLDRVQVPHRLGPRARCMAGGSARRRRARGRSERPLGARSAVQSSRWASLIRSAAAVSSGRRALQPTSSWRFCSRWPWWRSARTVSARSASFVVIAPPSPVAPRFFDG